MDDTECMHCSMSRYMKVVDEGGASITTKVGVKQLHYMLVTLRFKRLYPDIMLHPADSEAWEAFDRFDPKFAMDPRSVHLGLSTDDFQPHSNNSSPYSC
jgi:hypothetical protein